MLSCRTTFAGLKFRPFLKLIQVKMASPSSSDASPGEHDRDSELTESLHAISARITQAAQVNNKEVRMVAVSKLKPASDIKIAYEAGQRHFGENYVQELIEKANQLPRDIQWHFIGGLQSNKCKLLASSVPNLYAVETVDSTKKAKELNKGREGHDKLRIFLQVNTSGETEKSGVSPEHASALAKEIMTDSPNLELAGLMTIGSLARSRAGGENEDFKVLGSL